MHPDDEPPALGLMEVTERAIAELQRDGDPDLTYDPVYLVTFIDSFHRYLKGTGAF